MLMKRNFAYYNMFFKFILIICSILILSNMITSIGGYVEPTPEQVQECKELNIPEDQCSEQKILYERSKGRKPAGFSPEPNPLLNSDMLLIIGILGTIFGGSATLFFTKIRKPVESIRRKKTITKVIGVSLLLVGGFLSLFVTVASVIYSIEGTCLLIGGSDDRCVTGYNVGPSTFKPVLNKEFFWFSLSLAVSGAILLRISRL